MSVAPSSATTTGSTAAGTASTGTIPLAAAGAKQSLNLRKRKCRWAIDEKINCGDAGVGTIDVAAYGPSSFSQSRHRNESDQSVLYGPAGGTNPTAQTLTISNTGGGTLSWSASDSRPGCPSVRPQAPERRRDGEWATGTLTAGSYSGTVTLSATGASSVTVPVAFTVTAAPVPTGHRCESDGSVLHRQQGGSNPAPKPSASATPAAAP